MTRQRAYMWVASIIRGGIKATRQGTVNARDELEAIDKVYEMGKSVWNRLVVEVTIMGDNAGEVLATSKVGDRMLGGTKSPDSPSPVADTVKKAVGADKHEEVNNFPAKQAGMIPWNNNDNWYPSEFGRYFNTPTFGRLSPK